MNDIITLDYGSGGEKTAELIRSVLLPAFKNPALEALGDGAVLDGSEKLVFSTDSFVVTPWRFPGGDIGALSVCGTVNDLCMAGGLPRYLSLSFILEEGFLIRDLETIAASIARKAAEAGVIIATGDTKVVERSKGDGIYINTAGIGFLRAPGMGRERIREGDGVILSGSAGCHGAAVLMARAGLSGAPGMDYGLSDAGSGDTSGSCQNTLLSDCALLDRLSAAALSAGTIRLMRDPTRGGVATTLHEFIEDSPLTIELDEAAIPIDEPVAAACDLLGLDPLYCACEGRMLAVAAPEDEDAVLAALRRTPGGEQAALIGRVTRSRPGSLILNTRLGGKRLLTKLTGQQLPRIC